MLTTKSNKFPLSAQKTELMGLLGGGKENLEED